MNVEGFRSEMNLTRPGQMITITTGEWQELSGQPAPLLLAREKGAGRKWSRMLWAQALSALVSQGTPSISGGAVFQEAPASQFLQILKSIPESGIEGFTYMLSLPFSGIPGFTQKGFPGFSGWLTAVYEPIGWAEPLGERFFWIANLLLWIGWINLYAGLFNCLPAGPLDGGHIFRDLVQTGFERLVPAREGGEAHQNYGRHFHLGDPDQPANKHHRAVYP